MNTNIDEIKKGILVRYKKDIFEVSDILYNSDNKIDHIIISNFNLMCFVSLKEFIEDCIILKDNEISFKIISKDSIKETIDAMDEIVSLSKGTITNCVRCIKDSLNVNYFKIILNISKIDLDKLVFDIIKKYNVNIIINI